jgi:hypothetical protein
MRVGVERNVAQSTGLLPNSMCRHFREEISALRRVV